VGNIQLLADPQQAHLGILCTGMISSEVRFSPLHSGLASSAVLNLAKSPFLLSHSYK